MWQQVFCSSKQSARSHLSTGSALRNPTSALASTSCTLCFQKLCMQHQALQMSCKDTEVLVFKRKEAPHAAGSAHAPVEPEHKDAGSDEHGHQGQDDDVNAVARRAERVGLAALGRVAAAAVLVAAALQRRVAAAAHHVARRRLRCKPASWLVTACILQGSDDMHVGSYQVPEVLQNQQTDM
jgi:hypothetical protein